MHCLGQHPYRTVKPPPVKWVVCSLNQTQSLAIQEKFHALAGAECIDASTPWNPKTGYGANKPLTLFKNGSQIRWVTDDQGPRSVAGSTLDGVLVDEPCSPEMYRELDKRLLKRRGVMLLTFTPINGPTAHLREAIEGGSVREVHAPLTVENLRKADTGEQVRLEDGTPCDQAWIDEIWRETRGLYADIINNGGWEQAIEGVVFETFDAKKHVRATTLRKDAGQLRYMLGIDYAAANRECGQVAVLVQVLTRKPPGAGLPVHEVVVMDEAVASGKVTTDEFVDQVLAMLARNRLEWRNLDVVHGDNPVRSRFEERSNGIVTRYLASRLRVPQKGLQPPIYNAKEGVRADRQRDEGIRFLIGAFARDRIRISPLCKAVIEGLQTWDGSDDHPRKDVLDALRYALKPVILPGGMSSGGRTAVRFAA
jgi:hypothetical protein